MRLVCSGHQLMATGGFSHYQTLNPNTDHGLRHELYKLPLRHRHLYIVKLLISYTFAVLQYFFEISTSSIRKQYVALTKQNSGFKLNKGKPLCMRIFNRYIPFIDFRLQQLVILITTLIGIYLYLN